MTVPLIKNYKQINYVERKPHAVKESFVRIKDTLCGVVKQKKIFLFLVAFFFYIDGVHTVISMATTYGTNLGLDSTGMMLALLLVQILGLPFCLLYMKLAEKFGAAAEETAILYGGSCKPSNAAEIFAKEDVDGGLIGGAALKAEDFLGIGKGFAK